MLRGAAGGQPGMMHFFTTAYFPVFHCSFLYSQVIVQKTISNERKLTSVVQKVILQINAKLGGELWGCQPNVKSVIYHIFI